VPDRDVTGSWLDVDEPYVSLPAVPPDRTRAHRGNCRLFDTGRRKSGERGTVCWREMDSNFRFRDVLAQPIARF